MKNSAEIEHLHIEKFQVLRANPKRIRNAANPSGSIFRVDILPERHTIRVICLPKTP